MIIVLNGIQEIEEQLNLHLNQHLINIDLEQQTIINNMEEHLLNGLYTVAIILKKKIMKENQDIQTIPILIMKYIL